MCEMVGKRKISHEEKGVFRYSGNTITITFLSWNSVCFCLCRYPCRWIDLAFGLTCMASAMIFHYYLLICIQWGRGCVMLWMKPLRSTLQPVESFTLVFESKGQNSLRVCMYQHTLMEEKQKQGVP